MRSRVTGLFLAVILLIAAVPAVLDCCLRQPSHGGTPQAAVSHSIPAYPADTARGCVDRATPTQNPYIEPTTGGGSAPASARGTDATATYAAHPITATRAARRTVHFADGTGPPLWLSTCVSRT
jgi:hypothetical protein